MGFEDGPCFRVPCTLVSSSSSYTHLRLARARVCQLLRIGMLVSPRREWLSGRASRRTYCGWRTESWLLAFLPK